MMVKYENLFNIGKIVAVGVIYLIAVILYSNQDIDIEEDTMGNPWSTELKIKSGEWYRDEDLQQKVSSATSSSDYLTVDFLDLFMTRFYSETRKELQLANGERENNNHLILILLSLSLLIVVGGAASLLSTYKFRKAKEESERQSKEKIDYLYSIVTTARKYSNTGTGVRYEHREMAEIDDTMSTMSDPPGTIPHGGLLPAPGSGRIRLPV